MRMRRTDLFARTYTNPACRLLLHVLFWVFLLGSHYYFNNVSFHPLKGTAATWLFALKNVVVLAAAFYTLMYLVVPLFLAGKNGLPGPCCSFFGCTLLQHWIPGPTC